MITVETKEQKYQTRFDKLPIKIESQTGILTVSEILDGSFLPYALILSYSQRGYEEHSPDGAHIVKLNEPLPNQFVFEHVYGITKFSITE